MSLKKANDSNTKLILVILVILVILRIAVINQ